MLIGITCNRFGGGGGMERQAYDLVEGLIERGMPPVILTKKVAEGNPLVPRVAQIRRFAFPFGFFRDPYFSWRVDKALAGLRLDVLISFNRVSKADIVVCGGNHLGYMKAMEMEPGLRDGMAVELERSQFMAARRVFVCSRIQKDELVSLYGASPERVTVLYPAADTGLFSPASPETRESIRREMGFSPEKKVFLFPSRNHSMKGLPFIRNYFENTDLPVELVVAGAATGAGRNVRSLGYSRDIQRLYQAADATVLASRYEPFGMVAVESVLCGTPVIFSERAGACEAVDKPALYPIDPEDPQSLEHGVRHVLSLRDEDRMDLGKHVNYNPEKDAFVKAVLTEVEKSAP